MMMHSQGVSSLWFSARVKRALQYQIDNNVHKAGRNDDLKRASV
jgi:hypothetical protein